MNSSSLESSKPSFSLMTCVTSIFNLSSKIQYLGIADTTSIWLAIHRWNWIVIGGNKVSTAKIFFGCGGLKKCHSQKLFLAVAALKSSTAKVFFWLWPLSEQQKNGCGKNKISFWLWNLYGPMLGVFQNLISDHPRYGHAHAKLQNCI